MEFLIWDNNVKHQADITVSILLYPFHKGHKCLIHCSLDKNEPRVLEELLSILKLTLYDEVLWCLLGLCHFVLISPIWLCVHCDFVADCQLHILLCKMKAAHKLACRVTQSLPNLIYSPLHHSYSEHQILPCNSGGEDIQIYNLMMMHRFKSVNRCACRVIAMLFKIGVPCYELSLKQTKIPPPI